MSSKGGFTPEYKDVEVVTASRTLTRADSGKCFMTGAVDLVLTLPLADATLKGVTYTVSVQTLSTVTGFKFTPDSTQAITSKGLTATVGQSICNTAATDALGDSCTLVCDGSGWFTPVALQGTWAKV